MSEPTSVHEIQAKMLAPLRDSKAIQKALDDAYAAGLAVALKGSVECWVVWCSEINEPWDRKFYGDRESAEEEAEVASAMTSDPLEVRRARVVMGEPK